MSKESRQLLDQAFDGLEREVPRKIARIIHWLRSPQAKKFRIPIGLLLIAGGVFGFLPILGVEFIPLGLLVIAQDIPFLQKPMAKLTLWLERQWIKLREWWQRKRHKPHTAH